MVEKNILDEDFRKDTYITAIISQVDGAPLVSTGFKKREIKKTNTKRKAEASDGEQD